MSVYGVWGCGAPRLVNVFVSVPEGWGRGVPYLVNVFVSVSPGGVETWCTASLHRVSTPRLYPGAGVDPRMRKRAGSQSHADTGVVSMETK